MTRRERVFAHPTVASGSRLEPQAPLREYVLIHEGNDPPPNVTS